MICIFCLQAPVWTDAYLKMPVHCKDNPGRGCTYGLEHEFPTVVAKPKQVKKPDAQICIKCRLHIKNPASGTNGCAHEYPAV